jgi:hypothetical protein
MSYKRRDWGTKPEHHGPPTSIGECFYHGVVLTNKFCVKCQKSFCDKCLVEIRGRLYCNVCKTSPYIEAPPEPQYVRTRLRYRGGRFRWDYRLAEKPSPIQPSKHPGLARIFLGIIMIILLSLALISGLTEGRKIKLNLIGWGWLVVGFFFFFRGLYARKKETK